MPKADIASMTLEQLQDWFVEKGQKPFRGLQVFRWLHNKCAASFSEMTDLAKDLRAELPDLADLRSLKVLEVQSADDGTLKFRFGLYDGNQIEGVFIPAERRNTLCISTQVGCGLGCKFCATSSLGLVRNLSAGEIVGQLEAVHRHLKPEGPKKPVSNLVFMGMGEPLANLDAVVDAIEILLHPNGAGMSRRHLTVSTAGLVPAMEEFAHRVPIKLAVSLNATTDEVRDRIMPVNRRYPIARLMDCCRNLPLTGRDRITLEYVMLKGINDSLDDARRLIKLVSGFRAKVNLIPYNSFEGLGFERPTDEQVDAFLETLAAGSLSAFVRRSRGESLRAACGQLVAGDASGADRS